MMDSVDKVDAAEGKKALAPIRCKLQFKGMIHYGRAIRKINGRVYNLAIDEVTAVEAGDLEALKKQEPNLYIIK